MNNIWLSSDLHFFHKSMINNKFKESVRKFKTLKEMHKLIITNWNKKVNKTDKAFILGDASFGSKEETRRLITKLRGHKTLILGNHDRARTKTWWLAVGFEHVIEYPIVLYDKYILSHEPIKTTEFINYHGHLHLFSKNSPYKHLEYQPDDEYHINVNVEFNNYFPIALPENVNIKYSFEEE